MDVPPRRPRPQRCATLDRIGLFFLPLLALACGGGDQPGGDIIEGARRPASVIAAHDASQRDSLDDAPLTDSVRKATKRILFGDLHVHTTYSIDAFIYSLPFLGGEGAHPPADACDFARYCSSLDFFSLNDHAEALTPERWQRSKESLRECNARAGDGEPDLIAFAGWEWTQVGPTPETHYGHKNIIFPGLADDELPTRPITSLDARVMQQRPGPWALRGLDVLGRLVPGGYGDFLWWLARLARFPDCPEAVDTRQLPTNCRENAPTPVELFEKLDQWGFDTLVIPHGLGWGIHSPIGARLDNQLVGAAYDPQRQRLIETYSGHGNSEEYRPWSSIEFDAQGKPVCPAPTADFLPCCWQAGEIMRSRCGDLPRDECEARVEEAKRLILQANTSPHLVFADASLEDWLDCDQCRDCFKPAFSLRTAETAQYSVAISNFTEEEDVRRFRWGFIASSDNHSSRPGTGYKQYARRRMTDTRGIRTRWQERLLQPFITGTQKDPQQPQAAEFEERSLRGLLDVERGASFLYPGGLVAVHAADRSRESVWQAPKRREVYGTSGPRILLWFDLLDGPGAPQPMGSEVGLSITPRFEVRAVGSFVQKPGCPPASIQGLRPERLERLCRGECYNPSDERHRIAAIEVVRIRPQINATEKVDTLIEDPWRRFDCPADTGGCVVTFEDPDYVRNGRDTVYYVRALQEETPAINGANYRTEFDAAGNPVKISPCYGDYRTPFDDDCLAPIQERAWSSPIFVDWEGTER
jgi:hypothetical protein